MLDLFLTFVLMLASGDIGPERPPQGRAQASPTPVVRVEYYSMRGVPLESEQGAPPLGAQKGVMALRRADTPDRRLHEREVTFSTGGIRVHHTEEIIGSGRRLVWREFRPDGARTWVAEWDTESGHSSTTGYGWRRRVHGSLGDSPEANPPACGPLELLDGMREGLLGPGQTLALVEPAAASLSDVQIVLVGELLQARRSDGSIVCVCPAPGGSESESSKGKTGMGNVTFSIGTVLVPTEKDDYARARKRWFIPTRPAHERMLVRIPERR